MELAAPSIKKEYCRVAINDEGNLTIAIEKGGTPRPSESRGGYQAEHKHEDKHHHYLRREFSYSNYEQSYTLPDDVVRDKITPTCKMQAGASYYYTFTLLSNLRKHHAAPNSQNADDNAGTNVL